MLNLNEVKIPFLLLSLFTITSCSMGEVYLDGVTLKVDEAHKDCIVEDESGKLSIPECGSLGEFELGEGVTVQILPEFTTNTENVYLDFFLNGENLNIPKQEFIPLINGGYFKKAYNSFNLQVYYFAPDNIYVRDNHPYETFHHFDGYSWSNYNFENAIEGNTPDGFRPFAIGIFKVSENYITVPVTTVDGNTIKGYFLLKFSAKDNSYVGYETFAESEWDTLNGIES